MLATNKREKIEVVHFGQKTVLFIENMMLHCFVVGISFHNFIGPFCFAEVK